MAIVAAGAIAFLAMLLLSRYWFPDSDDLTITDSGLPPAEDSHVTRRVQLDDQLARSLWEGTFELEAADLTQARHGLATVIAAMMVGGADPFSPDACIRVASTLIDDEAFEAFLADDEVYEGCVHLAKEARAAIEASDVTEGVQLVQFCLTFPVGTPEDLTEAEKDAIVAMAARIYTVAVQEGLITQHLSVPRYLDGALNKDPSRVESCGECHERVSSHPNFADAGPGWIRHEFTCSCGNTWWRNQIIQ